MLSLFVLLLIAAVLGEPEQTKQRCNFGDSKIAILFENYHTSLGGNFDKVKLRAYNAMDEIANGMPKSENRKDKLAVIAYSQFPQDIYTPGDFYAYADVMKRIDGLFDTCRNGKVIKCESVCLKRSLDHAVERLESMPGTGPKVIFYIGTGKTTNCEGETETTVNDHVQMLKEEKGIQFVGILLPSVSFYRQLVSISSWTDNRVAKTPAWKDLNYEKAVEGVDLLCELSGVMTPVPEFPFYCDVANAMDHTGYGTQCDLAQTRIAIIFQNNIKGPKKHYDEMKEAVKSITEDITKRAPTQTRFDNLLVAAFDGNPNQQVLYEPGDNFDLSVVSSSISSLKQVKSTCYGYCYAMDWAANKLDGMPGTGPKIIVYLGMGEENKPCPGVSEKDELVDKHVLDLKTKRSIKFVTVPVNTNYESRLQMWADTRCLVKKNQAIDPKATQRDVVKYLCELSENARFRATANSVKWCDWLTQKAGLFPLTQDSFQQQPWLAPNSQELVFDVINGYELANPNATMNEVYFHYSNATSNVDFLCYQLRPNKKEAKNHEESVSIYPIRSAKVIPTRGPSWRIQINDTYPYPDEKPSEKCKCKFYYVCREIGVVEHGPIVALNGTKVTPDHAQPKQ